MHSRAHAFLTQPPYRGKLMRKWLTLPSLHIPTATPSDICSYYAKPALCQWVSCVVCLFFFVFGGLAPISVRRWKLHFPRYRLLKVSWKSVQPFPRTVVWYIVTDGKKTKKKQKKAEKKQKKTSVKHIRIRLIGGCVNDTNVARSLSNSWASCFRPVARGGFWGLKPAPPEKSAQKFLVYFIAEMLSMCSSRMKLLHSLLQFCWC